MAEQLDVDRSIEGMVEIFKAVLPPGEITADSDFFDFGGHSILAGQAVARARAQLSLSVSMRDFFAARTPKAIVEAVNGRTSLSRS
ncbi:hypothetical protein GCM10010517_75940 [Streptosporangium fragile]|uniref:Carrier domain-containing protein n=1 Tax=Streptosporangium fragile TaxID=46186 RepID=A0ABP6IU12_9ACTN